MIVWVIERWFHNCVVELHCSHRHIAKGNNISQISYKSFRTYGSIVDYLMPFWVTIPDSKVHGANMGPIWGRQDPGGPHVGPMNFAIWDGLCRGVVCIVKSCITYVSFLLSYLLEWDINIYLWLWSWSVKWWRDGYVFSRWYQPDGYRSPLLLWALICQLQYMINLSFYRFIFSCANACDSTAGLRCQWLSNLDPSFTFNHQLSVWQGLIAATIYSELDLSSRITMEGDVQTEGCAPGLVYDMSIYVIILWPMFWMHLVGQLHTVLFRFLFLFPMYSS